jgi:hypothetical protein
MTTRAEIVERIECEWYAIPTPGPSPTSGMHEELVRLVLLVDSALRGIGDD